MSKIPSILKNISHQVQSQFSQRSSKSKKIPSPIINKHLKLHKNFIQDKAENVIKGIQPIWGITLSQILANLIGIVKSQWPFHQQNKSIYLAIWGPISLTFFVHLLHNDPYYNKFMIFSSGLVDFSLILISGFMGYVYSNILKFPFNSFWNHICVSSHIGLITIVYCCLCTGSSTVIILLISIIYIVVCSYLHFNIYNQAIKPSLLQFLAFLIFIVAIYSAATIIFHQTFKANVNNLNPIQSSQEITKADHFLGFRQFSQSF